MEKTKEEMKARRDAYSVTLVLVLSLLLTLLCGCANIQEWKVVVVEDKVNKIKTTTTYYKQDTGFDLGTEGLGEYYIIKVDTL